MEKTNKNDIYETLLADITMLRFKPGEFIKEAELSREFNISRTPLREVIKRLALEGYITVKPRHGNMVSLIDSKSVKQMVDMRVALESKVHKDLCYSIKTDEIERLKDMLSIQEQIVAKGDADAFWAADNAFHEELFRLAGKSLWWETIKRFDSHYMRFRMLEISDSTNIELLYVHHKNILSVIVDRRFEDIEPNLTRHVYYCIERLPVLIDKYPDYFKRN